MKDLVFFNACQKQKSLVPASKIGQAMTNVFILTAIIVKLVWLY